MKQDQTALLLTLCSLREQTETLNPIKFSGEKQPNPKKMFASSLFKKECNVPMSMHYKNEVGIPRIAEILLT